MCTAHPSAQSHPVPSARDLSPSARNSASTNREPAPSDCDHVPSVRDPAPFAAPPPFVRMRVFCWLSA